MGGVEGAEEVEAQVVLVAVLGHAGHRVAVRQPARTLPPARLRLLPLVDLLSLVGERSTLEPTMMHVAVADLDRVQLGKLNPGSSV